MRIKKVLVMVVVVVLVVLGCVCGNVLTCVVRASGPAIGHTP